MFNYCFFAVRAGSILAVSFTADAFLPLVIFCNDRYLFYLSAMVDFSLFMFAHCLFFGRATPCYPLRWVSTFLFAKFSIFIGAAFLLTKSVVTNRWLLI